MSANDKAPDGGEWLPVGEVPTTEWVWARLPSGVATMLRRYRDRLMDMDGLHNPPARLVTDGYRFAPVADVAALRERVVVLTAARDMATDFDLGGGITLVRLPGCWSARLFPLRLGSALRPDVAACLDWLADHGAPAEAVAALRRALTTETP